MSTTITNVGAAFGGARLQAYTSTGRLWVAVHNNGNSRWEFWYSDNGTSFTEATTLRSTSGYGSQRGMFAIDRVTDRAVFATQATGPYVTVGISPTSTWKSVGISSGKQWYPVAGDLVTFQKPGGTNYYVAMIGVNYGGGLSTPTLVVAEFTNADVLVGTIDSTLLGSVGSGAVQCVIDFRHTGDGSTVAGSSPDLFVAITCDAGPAVLFYKFSWTGSTWTRGSGRSIGAPWLALASRISAAFDGTRFCMAWTKNADHTKIEVFERDAADTTTTSRTIPNLSGGDIIGLGVSYNGGGDMVVHASGATAGDIHRTRFVRSVGTWDAWTTLEATTVPWLRFTSSKAWRSGKGIAVTWPTAVAGPTYDVLNFVDFVNSPPNAPAWIAPVDNSAQDRGAGLLLNWQFNDPDTGDAQTAFALSRRINGGTLAYYNAAGGGSWVGTEVKNLTSTTVVTLPAAWAADLDVVEFKVKVWDGADVASPYSAATTVTASIPVPPTITAPLTNALLVASDPTITWTCPEQTAYQIRALTSTSAVMFSTGKVTDAVTRTRLPGFLLDNGAMDLSFEVTTWNTEGLASSDMTNGVDVDYDEPAISTLYVNAQEDQARIRIAITDPAPVGAQPAVTGHSLYVRVVAGGRPDGERTVGDDGIRIIANSPDADLYDRAPGIGTDYEYRVLTHGANDTSVFSAWT